jgi:hypothetical protein
MLLFPVNRWGEPKVAVYGFSRVLMARRSSMAR